MAKKQSVQGRTWRESKATRAKYPRHPAEKAPRIPKPRPGEGGVAVLTERKASVFIGSSIEGLPYANAVLAELERHTEPTVWDQNVFVPMRSALDALEQSFLRFDFAVLVLTPDDLRRSRHKEAPVPRDNVVAELGMFIGALGRDRVFFLKPLNEPITLPTDLLGITPLEYTVRSDKNYRASVRSACVTIIARISEVGVRLSALEAQGKPIDITGRWKYQCTAVGTDEYQWGGTCLIEQEKAPLGITWRLSGQRGWVNRGGTTQRLKPSWYWQTEWGTITDKKTIRFGYSITTDQATIQGYAYGVIKEVDGVANAIDGKFFQLPPFVPEHGLLEFRRMRSNKDVAW